MAAIARARLGRAQAGLRRDGGRSVLAAPMDRGRKVSACVVEVRTGSARALPVRAERLRAGGFVGWRFVQPDLAMELMGGPVAGGPASVDCGDYLSRVGLVKTDQTAAVKHAPR